MFTAARCLEAGGLRFPINVEDAEENAPPKELGRLGTSRGAQTLGSFLWSLSGLLPLQTVGSGMIKCMALYFALPCFSGKGRGLGFDLCAV